ncbi:MAG: HAMP domain-containing sensor histidine kinase [Oscillospiraceae bacterium]|nr:HAMP domain-containing sensor histidine kinase [Oscillospiraceae bacterium]
MRNRLFKLTFIFTIVIILLTMLFIYQNSVVSQDDTDSETIVALNEIGQLADENNYTLMNEKIAALQDELRTDKPSKGGFYLPVFFAGFSIIFMFTVLGYVYIAILKPFEKMKKYADKIAVGDFDLPLDYERSNYFGEFTWAFDSMRREITKARACEKEAVENNKTVIATLSHDIKTPVASIRAYSEGLEAGLDSSPEKRSKYLKVIMKKCDEVSALTNDLFIHSLSDLDKLKIYPEETELCSFTKSILDELSADKNDIAVVSSDFTAVISLDKNRYTQLVENIINNARKYAKTKIEVSFALNEKYAEIRLRDFGSGIPDEDMPFIFEKFYRGKNCGNEQGSGLGLYIVRYIARQMHGDVTLLNSSSGLEVTIKFLRTS